jgi:anti-anti-sigma factor
MSPPLPAFTITQRAPGRFSLSGELDREAVPRIRELDDLDGPLLLDLRGVTFIDSSGINELVRLYKRCAQDGRSLQIDACSDRVESVLRMVDLYDILTEDGVGHGPRPAASAPKVELPAELPRPGRGEPQVS